MVQGEGAPLETTTSYLFRPSNLILQCSARRSGIYETGILFGCLRKLERWTLSAILAEVPRDRPCPPSRASHSRANVLMSSHSMLVLPAPSPEEVMK
jgi:hypothetical protein